MDITHPSQYPLIAGQHAGKRVRCAPAIKPAYDQLYAHRTKNHWARIAVNELSSLSTGLAGKKNIYVTSTGQCRQDGAFYVFLPGLKATIEQRSNGEYILVDLQMDAMYFESTSSNEDRMGLYRAKFQRKTWQTEYQNHGQILSKDGRVVTIADSGYKVAPDAANASIPRIMRTPHVSDPDIRRDGCDLHFTPGGKRLGGLFRYNPINQSSTYGSARLLAESMQQARALSGVKWVADHGGSSVLTQAMRILADKGMSLKGHTVYLHRARTSPGDAVRLAHRLDMDLGEAVAGTGWDPVGAVSQARVAAERLNNSNDPYNRHYHSNAWINGVVRAAGATGLVGMGAASIGASIPVVASIGAIVVSASGIVGASGTAYSIGTSLKERLTH